MDNLGVLRVDWRWSVECDSYDSFSVFVFKVTLSKSVFVLTNAESDVALYLDTHSDKWNDIEFEVW